MTGAGPDRADPGAEPRRPVGRRPGDPAQTRGAILEAARHLFGSVGFDRATIRAIATAAEVDPALVTYHFGSKQDLFAAAHEFPFEPAELLAAVAAAPLADRGALLARFYLEVMGVAGSPALSLVRAATTNDDAATMLREFVTDVLLANASTLVPGPNGRLRLALAASQLMGLVLGRELIGLPVLREATVDQLVELVAPAVQVHLDAVDEVT